MLIKAVAHATGNVHVDSCLSTEASDQLPIWLVLLFPGRRLDKVKAEAQEKGDLGLVAESSRSHQRMMFQPASLTAGGVFRKLKEIANMSGNSVRGQPEFPLEQQILDQIIPFCVISENKRPPTADPGLFQVETG